MMSKNVRGYYTLKCLIRDLLSNIFFPRKADTGTFEFAQLGGINAKPVKPVLWSRNFNLYLFHSLSVPHEADLELDNINNSLKKQLY